MMLIDEILELGLQPNNSLSEEAIGLARLSLLDWIVCGRAGVSETVSEKLRVFADMEKGQGVASVFGGGTTNPRMAALVNGATSHALDFDDTHFSHIGHLSVALYPAVVAMAEERGATLDDIVAGFLVGAEVAIRVGMVLGSDHYNRGFHQTATAGAFGATVAAGRLAKLDAKQLRTALGLCATRASGLKCQFGTMGKPYNAGLAAANGIEAALLAEIGLTSADDGLEQSQGFIPTHTEFAMEQPAQDDTLFLENKYKFHACCHGLHAMLEALASRPKKLGIKNISRINIRTNPRWLSVCDIKAPRSGLEVKFSYGWLAGMALSNVPTGDRSAYDDDRAVDPILSDFARRVRVIGDASLSDTQVIVNLTTTDGDVVSLNHDLMHHIPQPTLATRLRQKARDLLGDEHGNAINSVIDAMIIKNSATDGMLIGRLMREGA